MPQPPAAASRDEPVIRERGDACPGALRLHAADDGHLARIRIPGGLLDGGAARVLAEAARRLGDGHIDLTSRGNVQLRGLGESCGGELADLLGRAGLLPAPTHERVRNIVASPLTGLDRSGLPDVSPWVCELDRLLCASGPAAGLSGRFLFALDDGRGDVVSLAADVNLAARHDGRALLWTGDPRDAVLVAAHDAPRAALLAAEYFLDAVRAAGTRAWRVAELPPGHALCGTRLTSRLAAAGIRATPASTSGPASAPASAPEPAAAPAPGRPPEPGIVPGPGDTAALSVLAPLGRLTADQWTHLAGLTGRIRLTPWRGVVVVGLPGHAAGDALAALAGAGLVTTPDDPWRSVTACTGRPGCAKSLADVRADARALVRRTRGTLPVHWSGCERRCGHPRGTAWVDAVATGNGYRLSVHGRELPPDPDRPDLSEALAAARNTPEESADAVKK
ncbi:cobalamin biosynthesis protein CobG [Streptomyces sp. CB00455]|uniref:precorrin-3B synthase n=1 Tax=Streptomyces sp. CB00455 TaxID=1703927 RepID=UPI00095A84EF|nr:precorrin-3B synthase [Streptomyces sp. CB00455]OKK23049.1 cobalamin biosynthesis protein CobG [Streptomyces sp. CB00455]